MYDIIIIGGGPAGLTAAIYASRANKKVLVIEKTYIGGQVAVLSNLNNYPGFEHIDGFSLSQKMYEQAKNLGSEFVIDEVVSCELNSEIKTIFTYKNTYKSKSVVIATGAYSKPLNLENEKSYLGRGLSYCATCDGNFFKNKKVAIVSNGNSGINDIIYLANLANELNVIFTQEAPHVDISKFPSSVNFFDNSKITKIDGEPTLNKITIQNKQNGQKQDLNVDGLFVNIGKYPYTDIFVGLEIDDKGYIVTDSNMRTNLKNVYAVGDVRNTPLKQIVTACSDGAVAVSTFISNE